MNTNAILSGIVLVLFVVLLVVLHKAKKARAEEQGADVGVAVFVEDPTEDEPCAVCEGTRAICDETGMFWEPCFMCEAEWGEVA